MIAFPPMGSTVQRHLPFPLTICEQTNFRFARLKHTHTHIHLWEIYTHVRCEKRYAVEKRNIETETETEQETETSST